MHYFQLYSAEDGPVLTETHFFLDPLQVHLNKIEYDRGQQSNPMTIATEPD